MDSLFENFGFRLTEKQRILFEKYYEILIFYNEKFNITAITEKREVFIKHFIDSLLGAKFINGNFIDVGSGGGFPALPVKILKPELKATLLDATEKKCGFLRETVKELGIKDVTVICDRAENLAREKNYRESFDCCISRAVAALPVLTEYCLPFVKKGGKFVAYKAADAEKEISAAASAINILGGKLETVEKTDLFSNTRAVIVINKEKNTPEQYPRVNSKIKKDPL